MASFEVETCLRFVSTSPRIEDSLGGIVSGDWKGPIPGISIRTFAASKIKAFRRNQLRD
jgi:hypothetical protein